jgi:hypothetical protein
VDILLSPVEGKSIPDMASYMAFFIYETGEKSVEMWIKDKRQASAIGLMKSLLCPY